MPVGFCSLGAMGSAIAERLLRPLPQGRRSGLPKHSTIRGVAYSPISLSQGLPSSAAYITSRCRSRPGPHL